MRWLFPWLLCLLVPCIARADALTLRFESCGELAEDEVRRIARIELGARASLPAEVEVRCVDELVRLRATRGTLSAGKSVSVADVDAGSRPRLLALAAAELVHELERLSKLPPSPPTAQPLPAAPEAARFSLGAGPMLLLPLRTPVLGIGVQVAGRLRVTSWLALGLGLEASSGERDISGGRLRHRSVSTLLSLRAQRELALVRLFLELSLLASRDELRGTPASEKRTGDAFHAYSFGTRLGAGVEAPFAQHGLVGLSLALGRKSRTLEAVNEGQPTSVLGPWFASGALALGARW